MADAQKKKLCHAVGFFIIKPKIRRWRHSQAVRQRSAKPLSPVRFRVAPPMKKDTRQGVFFRWTRRAESDLSIGGLPPSGWRLQNAKSTLYGCFLCFTVIIEEIGLPHAGRAETGTNHSDCRWQSEIPGGASLPSSKRSGFRTRRRAEQTVFRRKNRRNLPKSGQMPTGRL